MTDPATSTTPAAGSSTGTRAAVGASGAVVLTLVDQFFRAGGEDAGDFLARLGPVLGPLWSTYPIVTILAVVAAFAFRDWRASQSKREKESASLVNALGDLRTDLHGLRSALAEQGERTAASFDTAAQQMREHVRAEVAPLSRRVGKLEKERRGNVTAKARK